MHRLLRSHLAARNLDRAIGNDLVHIHVGLCAAPGLPDTQRELVIQLAGDNFIRGLRNQLRQVGRKFSQILIYQCARLLQDSKRSNQLRRHYIASNIKVQ